MTAALKLLVSNHNVAADVAKRRKHHGVEHDVAGSTFVTRGVQDARAPRA